MSDPESLLNVHLLNIAGGVFKAPDEPQLNVRRQLEVRKFKLWCVGQNDGQTEKQQICDRLRLELNEKDGDISMVYIPMIRDDLNSSLWWGTLVEELQKSDCDLIGTSQMTGCTFAWAEENRRLLLAHVQPVENKGGTLSPKVYRLAKDAKGLAPGEFYQPDKGEILTVIGKRSGSTWNLYAQVCSKNQPRILRVEKFLEWSPVAYVD